MIPTSPSHLYGLVDMGSNGIRFSITDLSPATARSLPTVFQDREGISLYDAQYATGEKGPIPQRVIDEVLAALSRFKTVCSDFHVPGTNIRLLATEATRNAVNSADYRKQIKEATGWEVDMLPKEAEGRIGAMGVASSFSYVEGLVMDLGGGSTQITWMVARDGKVETSPMGSFSFPYGAAAMTRQLAEIDAQPNSTPVREALAETMKQQFQKAYADLELPEALQHKAEHGGLSLYLSGGGFRGWGYLLMSQHKIHPYPTPIINGFQVSKRDFQQTSSISAVAAEESVFRISKRRAAQVPAVAFLVNVLVDALPMIKEIRFCQGGVREGFLYDTLDQKTRSLDPLISATSPYGTESAGAIAELLQSALPGPNSLDRSLPDSFGEPLTQALANLMYMHSSMPKESRALAALYTPVAGPLASAHGISHTDRALLSVTLSQRWNPGGDEKDSDNALPPPHDTVLARVRATLTQQEVFWANYLGAIAALVGGVYPAGIVPEGDNSENPVRLRISAVWSDGLGKKGLAQGIRVTIRAPRRKAESLTSADDGDDVMTSPASLNPLVQKVENVGKKKNRVGGREHGFGVPIMVEIERDL